MSTPLTQFDPPYDSPIQKELAWILAKYAADDIRINKEFEITTSVSNFRVDLVMQRPDNVAIGIECDGRAFHDPLADLFRDTLILGNSKLKAIYRFPGSILSSRPNDALYLLSHWAPEFFNDRICAHRDLLATECVKEAYQIGSWDDRYPYVFEWNYKIESGGCSYAAVAMHRFGAKTPPSNSPDRIWEFSRAGSYRTIEALADAYAAQNPTGEWRGTGYYVQWNSALFSSLDEKYFKK